MGIIEKLKQSEFLNKMRFFFYPNPTSRENESINTQVQSTPINPPGSFWENRKSNELNRRLASSIEPEELNLTLNSFGHLKIEADGTPITLEVDNFEGPEVHELKVSGVNGVYKTESPDPEDDAKEPAKRPRNTYFLKFSVNQLENWYSRLRYLKKDLLEVYGNISFEQLPNQRSLGNNSGDRGKKQFYVEIEAFKRTDKGILSCGILRLRTVNGFAIKYQDEFGDIKNHDLTTKTVQEDLRTLVMSSRMELIEQERDIESRQIIQRLGEQIQNIRESNNPLRRPIAKEPSHESYENPRRESGRDEARQSEPRNFQMRDKVCMALALIAICVVLINSCSSDVMLKVTMLTGTVTLVIVSKAFINIQNTTAEAYSNFNALCADSQELMRHTNPLIQNMNSDFIPKLTESLEKTASQVCLTMKSANEVSKNVNKTIKSVGM